jgi:predicted GIY-YIG superfamily endonuclease
VESQPDLSSAMKREHAIKKMSRKAKEKLISLNTNSSTPEDPSSG